MSEFTEILKTVERCIEHDLLSDDALKDINQIIIDDLDSQMKPTLSEGVKREVDPDCESGVCGAR